MEIAGLNNFYSLVAMHQKTHSFVFFYASQLVNEDRSCALSME